jgi:HMG (high mobility group) box
MTAYSTATMTDLTSSDTDVNRFHNGNAGGDLILIDLTAPSSVAANDGESEQTMDESSSGPTTETQLSCTPYTDAISGYKDYPAAKRALVPPQRPWSAYMIWSSIERRRISMENLRSSSDERHRQDINGELGRRWKAMTADERKPYHAESARLRELYKIEYPGFNNWIRSKKKSITTGHAAVTAGVTSRYVPRNNSLNAFAPVIGRRDGCWTNSVATTWSSTVESDTNRTVEAEVRHSAASVGERHFHPTTITSDEVHIVDESSMTAPPAFIVHDVSLNDVIDRCRQPVTDSDWHFFNVSVSPDSRDRAVQRLIAENIFPFAPNMFRRVVT